MTVLSKLMKQKTGYTFQELLQRKRFQKAVYLLVETELTVEDIALEVGYENNIKKKYQQYENHQHIKIAYSTNNSWNTLEPQIAYTNNISTLCTILSLDEKKYDSVDKIAKWMQKNKTDSA